MTSSKGDDGVLDLLPLMNKNILKYTDPKYHKSRPVIPGQWPNKTIDDGTDDDTVMNLHQRNWRYWRILEDWNLTRFLIQFPPNIQTQIN